jgi:hypothetical protein
MSAALWTFLDDPHPLDGVPVAYCEGSTWVLDSQVEHVADATVCDWWAQNCSIGTWSVLQIIVLSTCNGLRPYGEIGSPECK